MTRLPIDIDQSHGEVHVNDTLSLNGKSWRVARIEPGPSHYGYRVAGTGLREAAQALVGWYDGPPYAYVEDEMVAYIAALRAALSSEASIVPLRVTVWLEPVTE